jgi:hypothetical protein
MPVILALAALLADERGLYFGAPGGTVTAEEVRSADGPLSVELRFKALEKPKGSHKVVSRWAPEAKEADRGSFFVEIGPGKIAFGLLDAKGTAKTITARVPWKEEAWHHLLCVWDGSEAAIHLDGKKSASEKFEGPLAATRRPLVVGAAADPRNRARDFFEGFVSDVALWNAVREPDPKARIAGTEPGLALFLPLRGKVEGAAVSPSLARAGWCATPGWFDENPDRPWLPLFQFDAGVADPERQILVTNEALGEAGVLWQDKKSREVRISWVPASLGEPRTIPLKGLDGAVLAAGTADARGNLYYLMIGSTPGDAVKAAMYLAAPDGKPIRESPFDTSPAANNVYAYGGRWVGSMAANKDTVCLMLPRTMHMGGDGLRHQGAIAVTFGLDLSKPQNLGQTSGHSFGNLLTVNEKGDFIGMDLGDNYPRGVHFHRIGRAGKESRVLFTYKTAHGTTPRGGSPPYPEISGGGKTYYKWSNDNGTYTELGGVVEGRASYSVIFATDRSPEGRVLDNSRIGIPNEPRDLAMLRIVKNFEKAPGGSQVSDAIMAGPVPGSKPETGGFFDFGGQWQAQRVTGVIWLTAYAPGEAAHAPQLFRRRDGTVTILWEKTGPGAGLWALTVDESGKKIGDAFPLGQNLRLGREMLPRRLGPRIFTLAQDGPAPRLCFLRDE